VDQACSERLRDGGGAVADADAELLVDMREVVLTVAGLSTSS
jgi:hypothetical protein